MPNKTFVTPDTEDMGKVRFIIVVLKAKAAYCIGYLVAVIIIIILTIRMITLEFVQSLEKRGFLDIDRFTN